jgi:hypothetical protein
MFNVLIDTCVWLDLAKDHQQHSILSAMEELIRGNEMALILPRIVVDEFGRNKDRVVEEGTRSLSSTLKRVKAAVDKFGDPRRKLAVLRELDEVDHRLPNAGQAAVETVGRIEELFSKTSVIETSDSQKLRAAQRALEKRAPFHRQRNGIDDAILIEVYADHVQGRAAKGHRFAFVTHNTKDFSHPTGNNKTPHPDITSLFSRIKSLYFITLGEALRRVSPDQFAGLMIEQEWHEEPRRLVEIIDTIDELVTKVWYNRHQIRREKIEAGEIRLVEKDFGRSGYGIKRLIWEGALKAATKVEKRHGLGNLGPWDDFELGMLNGKLSALRWVLGEEWDMLDT